MLKNPGKLSMGEGTLEIPMELFAQNRRRLLERLRSKNLPKNSVVFLEGGKVLQCYDTDTNYVFQQESYFMWTFGVIQEDCFGAIEVDTGIVHLFFPRHPEEFKVWLGPIYSLEDFGKKYMVNNVHYNHTIASVLQNLKASNLLILNGVNSDSGLVPKQPYFDGIEQFNLDKTTLYNEIADLRVVKTALELEVMCYAIDVSSAAHRKIMRMAKPGKTEYQCESEFLHYCYSMGGCRNVHYLCICGSGTNSAVLHYGHAGSLNERIIAEGDMCLFDMGACYFGYGADITCSFPANGKFTPDQKMIYEAVLESNLAVAKAAKPGVNWTDMHILANRVLLSALIKGGLIHGDVDEMVEAGLGRVFQPHGLGHLLGLDVHDVGGYLPNNPPRCETASGLQSLRTARELLEGMVLTIEPGCYFIDCVLDDALKNPKLSKFIIPGVLERFRKFGGVRIEDNVVITATGVKNLTKVPRTVEEIESWIALKDDDKY